LYAGVAVEAVVVLTEPVGLFLQNEVLALPEAEEVLLVALLCRLRSRRGQMIVRDWSCYGAGR
jgi:hypothetical protein